MHYIYGFHTRVGRCIYKINSKFAFSINLTVKHLYNFGSHIGLQTIQNIEYFMFIVNHPSSLLLWHNMHHLMISDWCRHALLERIDIQMGQWRPSWIWRPHSNNWACILLKYERAPPNASLCKISCLYDKMHTPFTILLDYVLAYKNKTHLIRYNILQEQIVD